MATANTHNRRRFKTFVILFCRLGGPVRTLRRLASRVRRRLRRPGRRRLPRSPAAGHERAGDAADRGAVRRLHSLDPVGSVPRESARRLPDPPAVGDAPADRPLPDVADRRPRQGHPRQLDHADAGVRSRWTSRATSSACTRSATSRRKTSGAAPWNGAWRVCSTSSRRTPAPPRPRIADGYVLSRDGDHHPRGGPAGAVPRGRGAGDRRPHRRRQRRRAPRRSRSSC